MRPALPVERDTRTHAYTKNPYLLLDVDLKRTHHPRQIRHNCKRYRPESDHPNLSPIDKLLCISIAARPHLLVEITPLTHSVHPSNITSCSP